MSRPVASQPRSAGANCRHWPNALPGLAGTGAGLVAVSHDHEFVEAFCGRVITRYGLRARNVVLGFDPVVALTLALKLDQPFSPIFALLLIAVGLIIA